MEKQIEIKLFITQLLYIVEFVSKFYEEFEYFEN